MTTAHQSRLRRAMLAYHALLLEWRVYTHGWTAETDIALLAFVLAVGEVAREQAAVAVRS